LKITLTQMPDNDRALIEDMNLALAKAMSTFSHPEKNKVKVCACLLQAAHQAVKGERHGEGRWDKEDFLELAAALYDNAAAALQRETPLRQIPKRLANPDLTEPE